MLVASRDPFHGSDPAHVPGPGTRLARTMGLLQIVGTVLAIPVGIGSAYTMYKSNFSAEATCQSLRANIVLILDKSVDAGARHMLVRRDVEAFEHTCGDVDPDAAAAFKALLAVDKTVAHPAAVAAVPTQPPAIRKIEMTAKNADKNADKSIDKPVERKADPKVDVKVEPKAEAKPVIAAVAAVQRDPANSDNAWLEAVRGALVNHTPEAAPAELVSAPAADAKHAEPKAVESKVESKPAETKAAVAAPALRPAVHEPLPPLQPLPQTTWSAPASEPAAKPAAEAVETPTVAPALPPPASIANVPEPQPQTAQADESHPVPPGAIPETRPSDMNQPEERSRIGALISHTPVLNRVLDK